MTRFIEDLVGAIMNKVKCMLTSTMYLIGLTFKIGLPLFLAVMVFQFFSK